MFHSLQKFWAISLVAILMISQSISGVFGYRATGMTLLGENKYTLVDSTENDGPVYAWKDISHTTQNLIIDSTTASLDVEQPENFILLEEQFPFLEENIYAIYVSPTEGRLSFHSTHDTVYFLHGSTPWDNPEDTFIQGKVYTSFDTVSKETIIQFKNMVTRYSQSLHNFEIIIQPNGKITLQYANTVENRKVYIWGGNMEDFHYGDRVTARSIPANTALQIIPNSHAVSIEIPAPLTSRLRTNITLTGTGANVANEPVTLEWRIQSIPPGSQLKESDLWTRNTQHITFQADVPGKYEFSLRGTNSLPGFSDFFTEKTVTVEAYGLAFFSDTNRLTPIRIEDAMNTVYASLREPNYTYARDIPAILTTEVSKDSQTITLIANAVEERYEFWPLLVHQSNTGVINNDQVEIGNNEQVVLQFSPTQKLKQDFWTSPTTSHSGSIYAGETTVSYIQMNTANDLANYRALFGTSNGKLLMRNSSTDANDTVTSNGVGMFWLEPLTHSVESSILLPNGKRFDASVSLPYTRDNVHFYDYSNFNSAVLDRSEYLNKISASGWILVSSSIWVPSNIPKIQSFVLTDDQSGFLFTQEWDAIKRFTIENNTLVLWDDITYDTLTSSLYQQFGINRMLALDTAGNLLLISTRSLSYSSWQVTVHRISPATSTEFTENDKIIEYFISTESLKSDYIPLQTLVTQRGNSFWIHNLTNFILKIDTENLTSQLATSPNTIEQSTVDTSLWKVISTHLGNDLTGVTDFNICTTEIAQENWNCSYLSEFLDSTENQSKLPKPKYLYGQIYWEAGKKYLWSTDIGLIFYSIETATWSLGTPLVDSPEYTSLQTVFDTTRNILKNISGDDQKYQITEPAAVCEGCVDWIGWNQQVYTLPVENELKNDDTLELIWKGYNTATPQDVGKNDIYLEVYNHVNDTWDLGDVRLDNTATSDFELKAIYTKETIPQYLNNSEITYRVREYEWRIQGENGFSLHTNYVYLAQNTASIPATIGYNPIVVVPPAPVNTPPTLSPISNRTLTLWGTVWLTVTATDTDVPANTLTYSLISANLTGATLHPSSWQFLWTPTALGTYQVNLAVTDNGTPPLTTPGTFTITVNPAPVIPVSGGGGGSSVVQDICPNGDTSPSYSDGICSLWNGIPQVVRVENWEFTGVQGSVLQDTLRGTTNYTGAILTYSLVDFWTGGQLTVQPRWEFTFYPDKNFIGDFSFSYRAKSNEIWSNTGIIQIHIIPLILPSAPPEALASPVAKTCHYRDMDFSQLRFQDISRNTRKGNIELLLKNCIVNGRTKKAYQPTDTATRAEFTKVVLRSIWIQYDFAWKNSTFRDIPPNDWRAGVTEEAFERRIVRGIQREDGVYFEGDRAITKREALLILVRALQENGDIEQAPGHTQTYQSYQEILRSYGVRDFLISNETLTRDEMAKIVSTIFRKRYPLELKVKQA
jgi:hypothetical protein